MPSCEDMEPSSKMFGSAEECHSSESGWTMYIGSPTVDSGDDEDRDIINGDDDEGTVQVNLEEEDHDESDDSMASDASSKPWGANNNGLEDFQQVSEEENEDRKYFLDKKEKEEKKEKVIITDVSKGKAPVLENDGKVMMRKNYLLGKTK
ncbi:hypothetical protein RIF29_07859 [Crotalaria pallida]|uniref:Uncharacterized protein n=1 Tax=Crotalaria pallida TaxID=3830 RepID=A0AAN9J4K0_CROPI